MAFRSLLSATLSAPILAVVLMAAGSARAEDPFLGIIKEIKCVNCKPGWVTLLVNDPIETRDFELYLKDTDYNKIITPLPGKSIHEKNGECFYWIEKPKTPKSKDGKAAPAEGGAKKPAAKAAPGAAGKPSADSMGAGASDSSKAVPPPAPEAQGKESSCIRFYRQMN